MNTNRLLKLSSSMLIGLAFAACAAKRPYELNHVEAKLKETKNDTFVVANAPLTLNKAEKTYERADKIWRETKDKEEVIPIARLAQEQLDAARLEAGKNASSELAHEVSHQREILAKEQEIKNARKDAHYYGRLADDYSAEAQSARRTNMILLKQLNDLSAQQARERMMLSLDSALLFEVDGTLLTAGGQKELMPLATFLKNHPANNITIEGHTDSSGNEQYNQDLSKARAESVADFLAGYGIPRSRMTAIGRGESYPIASNQSSAGRLQNRRVEVTINPAA